MTLLLGEWKRKSCSSFERQSTQQQYLYDLNNLHSWRGAPFCLCAPTEAADSDGSTCCRRHLSGDELKPIHEVSAQPLPEDVQQNTSMSFWIETIQLSPNLVTFLHTNPSIYRNSRFNNVNKQKALLLHSKIKEAGCVIELRALSLLTSGFVIVFCCCCCHVGGEYSVRARPPFSSSVARQWEPNANDWYCRHVWHLTLRPNKAGCISYASPPWKRSWRYVGCVK